MIFFLEKMPLFIARRRKLTRGLHVVTSRKLKEVTNLTSSNLVCPRRGLRDPPGI